MFQTGERLVEPLRGDFLGAVVSASLLRRSWGYGPSGLVGLILVVVLILALLGKL